MHLLRASVIYFFSIVFLLASAPFESFYESYVNSSFDNVKVEPIQ